MMNTALLIIDIQNDYFDGGTNPLVDSEKAAENAKKILEKFRSDNRIVVFMQHVALSPTSTFFLPNTSGVQINKIVEPLKNEKVIVKHYPNSFRETELLEFLQNNKITNLVICGMMTHMCIDATTRAAKDLGFNITLISDACATKNLEFDEYKVKATDVHHSFLAALKGTYATIVTTEEFLFKLKI